MTNLRDLEPSELLELALRDLTRCERDPLYAIDMRFYHLGVDDQYDGCCVCFAGSVLAKSLNWDRGRDYEIGDHPDQESLTAIDLFRIGEIGCALFALGRVSTELSLPGDLPYRISIPPYTSGRAEFKTGIRTIINLLRESNL